ncbi:2-amino-4-hydroxy-6-hydroxymethyldihydropteridine diphosphokinase [Aeromonas hydrophila]|uniref:2-amino-4-hydroxy-6-hydroxymethyldihydropteridine diphosphokinase n=1 Tax=Aeromonas hydrophila TaxID=644 RepID=A0A926IYL0_AERHY|nr:2-amino-4-hydroxy-6-hydroxymethyldihydropteridine diphosphokinase [Aeromonas hydrophila]
MTCSICSIGSNLDPHQHVSQAVGELLVHFGRLQLSSVIQTKPVGMHSAMISSTACSSPSELAPHQLKAHFVAMELAHGRDRSDPRCKVLDRPLDIDILASSQSDDFSTARVDAYLDELLAELYGRGQVHDRKVTLPLHTRLMAGKVIEERQVGLAPSPCSRRWRPGRAPALTPR